MLMLLMLQDVTIFMLYLEFHFTSCDYSGVMFLRFLTIRSSVLQ